MTYGFELDSYGDDCEWYDSKINQTFCGRFDTEGFRAREMCCACGGGSLAATGPSPEFPSLSLAARYLREDTIIGKYIPEDIGYGSYLLIATLALPTLLFWGLTSPFLLLGQVLGADWINGHQKIVFETLKSEFVPLGVALACVFFVSFVIIRARNSRKGRDDYHVAQEI